MDVILGAGMTGLSAGIKTGAVIYEASDKVGGICRSYYQDGFRFENGGGHWIFGMTEKSKSFIEKYVSLKEYRRKAGVYYNQMIDYPIQAYFDREEGFYSNSMKGWLYNKFGGDQCRMFFFPFNEKYTDGLYDSVIQDDPHKSPDPKASGYNDTFYYPKDVGLDVLADRMAEGLDIRFNKQVTRINLAFRVVYFSDGTAQAYDRLISTLPLKATMKLAGIYDEAEDNLPHTSVVVLNIGAIKGENCPDKHWVYIPSPNVPFFRVGFYSNVDESFADGDKRVSIYVERAFQDYDPDFSTQLYAQEVERQLKAWGWIENVKTVSVSHVPHAYTWLKPNHQREQNIADLLEKYGILSTGRYGVWKFCGISESIEMGLAV